LRGFLIYNMVMKTVKAPQTIWYPLSRTPHTLSNMDPRKWWWLWGHYYLRGFPM